jgi:UDP-glucose 4-epimerase
MKYQNIHTQEEVEIQTTDIVKNYPENKFDVFNIGTGEGYSVLDIVNTFQKENNVSLKFVFGPKRAGDIIQVWADNSKAKSHLHWQAKHTLSDMVKSAWQWQLALQKS